MLNNPTAHNRTVNVRRLKAARLRKIAVGLTPFVQFSLRQSFLCPKMLRIFLIGHKKPSFTAGTLGEINIELVGNSNKLKNIHFTEIVDIMV